MTHSKLLFLVFFVVVVVECLLSTAGLSGMAASSLGSEARE
jgi:uncharacterized membrane protein YtjA (UPF0391 family)